MQCAPRTYWDATITVWEQISFLPFMWFCQQGGLQSTHLLKEVSHLQKNTFLLMMASTPLRIGDIHNPHANLRSGITQGNLSTEFTVPRKNPHIRLSHPHCVPEATGCAHTFPHPSMEVWVLSNHRAVQLPLLQVWPCDKSLAHKRYQVLPFRHCRHVNWTGCMMKRDLSLCTEHLGDSIAVGAPWPCQKGGVPGAHWQVSPVSSPELTQTCWANLLLIYWKVSSFQEELPGTFPFSWIMSGFVSFILA